MESLGAPLWTADRAHKPSGGFTAAEYAPLGNMGDFPTFRRRGMKGGFGGTAGRWWGQLASDFHILQRGQDCCLHGPVCKGTSGSRRTQAPAHLLLRTTSCRAGTRLLHRQGCSARGRRLGLLSQLPPRSSGMSALNHPSFCIISVSSYGVIPVGE